MMIIIVNFVDIKTLKVITNLNQIEPESNCMTKNFPRF